MRLNSNKDNGVYTVNCSFIRKYDGATVGLQTEIKGFMGAVAYAAMQYNDLNTLNGVFISKGEKRYKVVTHCGHVMATALTRYGWKSI